MIYLSGKITDKNPAKEKANTQRFKAKAEELRLLGLQVFNPAEYEADGWKWENYLAKDIDWIYRNKPDTIYLMKGWEKSLGARLEKEVAGHLGMKIIKEA